MTEVFPEIRANGGKLPQQAFIGDSFWHVNLRVEQAVPSHQPGY
jgi:hypothetical protein